jgi:hypothetical protein
MASVMLLAGGALACAIFAAVLIGGAIRYRKEPWAANYRFVFFLAVILLAGSAEWCFSQALKKAEAVDNAHAPPAEPAKAP